VNVDVPMMFAGEQLCHIDVARGARRDGLGAGMARDDSPFGRGTRR